MPFTVGSLPTRPTETIVTEADLEKVIIKDAKPSKPKRSIMSLDFLGDIAKAIPAVTGQFNSDYQQSQVEIAQANARSAEANSSNNQKGIFGDNSTMIYAVIAIVVLIAMYMAFKPKPNA